MKVSSSFIMLLIMLTCSALSAAGNGNLEVKAAESNEEATVLDFSFESFDKHKIDIDNEVFYRIELDNEPFLMIEGEPELPYVNRSIIIPDMAAKEVTFLEGEFKDYKLQVIPSKGVLYRYQDPEVIPYTFGDTYQQDKFYPGKLTELSDPFIIRDYRGQTVSFYPFQYNPVKGILRVYKQMKVEVRNTGISDNNIFENHRNSESAVFRPIYESLFLNYPERRHDLPAENGRMIVISYDPYIDVVQPFVEWKNQRGIKTDIYPVSTIGDRPNDIKEFIQTEYDRGDGLTYIQLVGNGSQVPTYRTGSQTIGPSDPVYSLLAGDDDYPDVFVGRFSAYNLAQVETQVQRSIEYERDMNTGNDWLMKAAGIASHEGGNNQYPSDIEHMDMIRDSLLAYGHTEVDRIYGRSAAALDVTNAVQDGRGLINYTGHGRVLSWSTTGFSRLHVDSLINDNMLPFILSVACQNGNFTGNDNSFAESWVRAVNDNTGSPTGAIAFYGSSINQAWYQPMAAQVKAMELLTAGHNISVGGACFGGSVEMINRYPSAGATEFKTWNILGDASLMLRTKEPQEMTVIRPSEIFVGHRDYQVDTDAPFAYIGLSYQGEYVGSGYADENGFAIIRDADFPLEIDSVDIVISAHNFVTYTGTVDIIPNEGPYLIIEDFSLQPEAGVRAVQSGDFADCSIRLKNIGIKAAESVKAVLSTDDRFVTVIDSVRSYDTIDTNQTVEHRDAFRIRISDAVPNQHNAVMNLRITDSDRNEWNWQFNFDISAPDLVSEMIVIDDSLYGNDDGRIDPGETVYVYFPTKNTGDADTKEISVSLTAGADLISIDSEKSYLIDSIEAGGEINPRFRITASEELQNGSVVTFGFSASSGMYFAQASHNITIGLNTEDFSSGDFERFEWQFSDDAPWRIDTIDTYEGEYAARSGSIEGGQTSGMYITTYASRDGQISFYRRVSSEMGFDFLRFYINDRIRGEWSGDTAWRKETYDVEAGENTFKWVYSKSGQNDHFYDSVWIDKIKFPTTGSTHQGPMLAVYPESLDFGTVEIGDRESKTFFIRNVGTEPLTGQISSYDGFTLEESPYLDLYNEQRSDIYQYSIPPGSSIPVQVSFTPTAEFDYDGELIVTGNSVNTGEIRIKVEAAGGVLSADEDLMFPLVTELKHNYPNPFNPATTIAFSLETASDVTVEIYNIRGQKVNILLNEKLPAGNHSVIWDGRDSSGRSVSSGVYLYRMVTPEYNSIRRMLFLK